MCNEKMPYNGIVNDLILSKIITTRGRDGSPKTPRASHLGNAGKNL